MLPAGQEKFGGSGNLDAVERTMTVSTTRKTCDLMSMLNARDLMTMLNARDLMST